MKWEIKEGMAHLKLDRGSSNALNRVMVDELLRELKAIEKDASVSGLILHGKPGFFSSGLDLIELYHYNEEEIHDFWRQFLKLLQVFVEFPKPTVAAIGGHSPAGGCLLALCCDYRIMAEGDFIIGLNEVPVGIIVPERIFSLYAFWLGQARAYEYLLEGKLLKPQEALQVGLVNEVTAANRLITQAEKQMKAYLQFNGAVWRSSKLNIRRKLIGEFNADANEEIEQVLKQWWTPSNRQALKSILDNLLFKSKR